MSAPTETPRSALPSRNPMPLSASQEGQVKDIYFAKVRGLCAEEIRLFAECARGRTITATWACKDSRAAMNKCMISHATQENKDAAREEWFRQRMEKKKLKPTDPNAQVEVVKGAPKGEVPEVKRAGWA
ncbi:cytochrome c oxidase biogenesis protein Cmc1 like-domain-containing protein [Pyronema domesticum]|uniref:COX assembly mitochondrial protein n=1 Tax=Pyronema omphalodes (strain CBS 100304) TaxID=1076935 RepID=U4LGZ2_PYROM|nr:cytochrome c oxidase biogenesis protein Cmc1 like-domain-containing protein [Pyronema domesticum]CCX31369.1 Similar to Uncharacterized protein DDB_G0275933; acc. no. Q552P9 [Pyronema omphalodes CBS 100304]